PNSRSAGARRAHSGDPGGPGLHRHRDQGALFDRSRRMIDEIRIEQIGGGAAELVLNRPAKHNAITPAMSAAIREALKSLESDSEVRCVLVRGAGERAFCAGTDLHSLDDFADAWAWRNSVNYALEFNAF